MTESEWLSSEGSREMLDFLTEGSRRLLGRTTAWQGSDRKLRLFACSAFRLLCDTDEERGIVERVELFADGGPFFDHGFWVANKKALDAATQACELHRYGLSLNDSAGPIVAGLLREIVGNPFRPVSLPYAGSRGKVNYRPGDPVRLDDDARCPWLTPDVISLATAAYEDRPDHACSFCRGAGSFWPSRLHADEMHDGNRRKCDWCRGRGRIADGHLDPPSLQVLADALEEAGCPTRVETEGPEALVDSKEVCPYCSRWPDNSPRGENGWVKCKRWVSEHVDERYGQCKRCNRVWLPGYDTVCMVSYPPHPLLAHLRSEGPHVRGCWALDLLLGRT